MEHPQQRTVLDRVDHSGKFPLDLVGSVMQFPGPQDCHDFAPVKVYIRCPAIPEDDWAGVAGTSGGMSSSPE